MLAVAASLLDDGFRLESLLNNGFHSGENAQGRHDFHGGEGRR